MKLENYRNIYFVGIGGIGMSALARYFHTMGKNVFGYDRTTTKLTAELIAEGIGITFEDDLDTIPDKFMSKEDTLIVFTPAIPKDHQQLSYFRLNNFSILKRSQVLGLLSDDLNGIGIAGTHGKTTVSTITAHIFHTSALGCNAFLGGISRNYQSNLLLSKDSSWVILEADEFDRSFLQLHPKLALITSMDADHLDIYGDVTLMHDSFNEFALKTVARGHVIVKENLKQFINPNTIKLLSDKKVSIHYFGNENADIIYDNINIVDGKYTFDYRFGDLSICDIEIGMPGIHNLQNMVAAISAVYLSDVNIENVKAFAKSFKGIKRRFEMVYDGGDKKYIDDYAHHPAELEATISSVKSMYPNKKILGVFQPHLFSRTNDFYNEFAFALDDLDEVILLPIYPAREMPMIGVKSEMILSRMKNKNGSVVAFDNVLSELKKREFDILLTLGAGDIDLHVESIKEWLLND
jgi:UDP-N-acetylmuramate--alanine ligase